jgi:glucose/arabinose dehydrogenase
LRLNRSATLRGGALLLAILVLDACDGASTAVPATVSGPDTVTPTPTTAPNAAGGPVPAATTPPAPTPRAVSGPPPPLTLQPAFGGRRFQRPTEAGPYPGGRLFVADQFGLVLLITSDGGDAGTLLDLRNVVYTANNEEGLLSVALDPAFASNRYLYAYYSLNSPRRTRLARFAVLPNDAVDRASELVIVEQEQPFGNHKGGSVRFGPDGLLYLGLGDGGSQGDPRGNGQSLETLLAKIIRIDVRNATAQQPYEPRGHPALASGGRPEIFATGMRNPWRMTFDWGGSLALIVADVGGTTTEEIDIIEGGRNYGWSALEGHNCLKPALRCDNPDFTPPVFTYNHAEGCSVTGGEVYHGRAIPALVGYYLFADYCSGRMWAMSLAPAIQAVRVLDSGLRISSFFRDEAGEVYVLAFGQAIHRVAGR